MPAGGAMSPLVAGAAALALLLLLLNSACAAPASSSIAVWRPQPQLTAAGSGRNIRQLPCVSRRTGETGVCMFAYACLKANGTHLGTCIDRFYFGSCCRLDGDAELPPSVLYQPTEAPTTASTTPRPTAAAGTTAKPTSSRPTVKPKPSAGTTARPPTKKPTRKPPVFKPTTPSATKPAPSAKPSPQSPTGPYTKPVSKPSTKPPTKPTTKPTTKPPTKPTTRPTTKPTTRPTTKPTTRPTPKPTTRPTPKPTSRPTVKPTSRPATQPASASPTKPASEQPTTSQVLEATTAPSPTPVSPTSTNTTKPAASGVTTQQTVWSAESNATTASPATASSGSVSLVTWTLIETAASPSPASQTGAGEATTSAGWVEVSLSQPEAATSAATTTTTTTTAASTTTTTAASTTTTAAASTTTTSASASSTAAPDTLSTATATAAATTTITTPTSTSTTTSPASTASTSTITTTTTTPSTTIPTTTLAAITESTTGVDELLANLSSADYREVCGRRLVPDARIVGGQKASFGKWPWQISLRQWRTSTYLHKCGAALLNENWAVTAAHCVENVPPSDLLLRLGEHDVSTEDEPYGFQERRVQIVASHPQFDPRTFEYDLALLRFYEPVPFQPNIIPICVPSDDTSFVGHTAHVTGWGRLYEDGPLPSVLQEVSVPVINNTLCESMYRSAGYIEHIPEIFICAGWQKGGSDSCEGDSGGPMVIQREDKRWLLAGVISWGIGCAEPNQPGVYTRISEFREWINQILQF